MNKRQHRQARKYASANLASLALAALVGCAGGGVDGNGLDESSNKLTDSMWMDCANAREFCAFDGSRSVRYGRDDNWTYRTFTGGVQCTRSAFGATTAPKGAGNVCQYEMTAEEMGMGDPSADAGTPAQHDAGSMGGMDMGATTTTGTMMGPTIDKTAIPLGDPGNSTVLIQSTSEKPVPSDIGAFRTACLFSHMKFDDPIVFPGQPGKSHLHTFFGNTGADAYSTATSLRNSGNSTCRGGIANRSSYWAPAVIDAQGKPVKPVGMNVYYKTGYNGIKPQDVKPFPQGLRMIAGNAKATSADQNENGMWGCLQNYIGHPRTIPQCQLGDDVILIVAFPQCWDGKNVDSSDHKSHMSYTVNGACPATHPVPIPEITFNIRYKQPAGGTAGWRLASDMYDPSLPGGYSAHADYFEGWDPTVSNAFIKNCDNTSSDCHEHLLGDGRMIYNPREPQ